MSGRFVVEADGGSRGNPGPAAYGVVIRDASTGQVVARLAEAIGEASNNVAEYRGLIAGLSAVAALDSHAVVEVRLDSRLVVEQMSGRWKIKHPDMRRLALQARQLLDQAQIRYVWVPRAQNADADRLANEALDDAAIGRPWRGAAELADRPAAGRASRPTHGVVDSSAPTTLLLVRHAVTELTTQRRFSGCGGQDPQLSELGRRQATALADRLAHDSQDDMPWDVVVCSPRRRTRETAEAIASRIGLPVHPDPGWAETDFGAWDGLTAAEVVDRWPDDYRAWLASTAVAPPGGESADAMAVRVVQARDRVLARWPGRRIVVVTHAGPVRTFVTAALGVPVEVAWRLEVAPASVTRVRWWLDGGVSVAGLNSVDHLRPGTG
ncbi:MAG: bifunctional RNase H/acid phosphatase [Angustibacter sp.]